jgi:hypothetical protein
MLSTSFGTLKRPCDGGVGEILMAGSPKDGLSDDAIFVK